MPGWVAASGFPGRPLRLALGLAAGAEGEAPFRALAGRLESRLERPVEVVAYRSAELLTTDLGRGRADLAIVSAGEYQALRSVKQLRVLGAMVLDGKSHYAGVMMGRRRGAGRGPVAVASAESYAARLLVRSKKDMRVVGSPFDALEAVIEGEAGRCGVSEEALREARRQGMAVAGLRELARSRDIPYDALVVGPEVPPARDAAVRAALLGAKSRSPSGITVEWRAVDSQTYRLEVPR